MKEINIPDSIRYVSKGAFFNTSVFEVVDNLYMIDRKIVTGATKYEETMEIPDGVIGICKFKKH